MKNKTKNIIIAFIMASFSYYVLCNNSVLKAYDVNSWIIYAMMLALFLKTDIISKDNRKESIGFSLFFSIILVIGHLLYINIDNKDTSIIRTFFSLESFIIFITYFNLIYIILKNIFSKLYTLKITELRKKRKMSNKKLFFIFAIIIFLSWLPYFLSFYPGTLSPDSLSEYASIKDGLNIVINHHPVLHVLFIGLFHKIGLLLFKDEIAAIATVTIAQMIIMACIFSYNLVFLRERKIKFGIIIVFLICYCLLPMNGYYSIVMWKDVIFAGLLSLLTIESIKLIEKEKNDSLTIKNVISFIIVSLLCVLFRNNAIYMYYLLSLVFIIFFDKKNRKIIVGSLVFVIAMNILINGPIFRLLNIKNTESSEYIGMPMQQIGRMAYKDVDFDKEETKTLNKLIPIEEMKKTYNPKVSDGIKRNPNYRIEVFDNNKLKYLKLYLRLVYKHPSIATEAYMISTLGYWYPGVEYWSVASNIWENEYGLETKNLLTNSSYEFIRKIEYRSYPILAIEWSIGLYTWVLIISFYISLKKKGKKSLIAFIPCIGILITMFLASPVFGEFRYVYCIFVTIPILMTYPYLEYKKAEK